MNNKKHDEDFFRTVYGNEELEKLKKLELSKQKEDFVLDEGLDDDIYPIRNNLKQREMKKFEELFNDFKPENSEKEFEIIAKSLMTEFVIKINKHEFYFTEIEFYCKTLKPKEDVHNDLYVHGDDLQKEFGKWYFHGSGLDLTFGNTNYYGGILVRGVKTKIDNGWEYVSGPQKVIKKLFSKINNVGEKSTFHLEHKDENKIENQEVYFSTRVGLNPKVSEDFFNKKYRAITDISSKHPFKEKENVYRVLKEHSKYKEEELIKLFGYKIK